MASATDQQLLESPRPAHRVPAMLEAPVPLWLWPNLLSLDAPLVAVVWQEAFAATLGASLGWAQRLVLFAAVWLVYAGDRWLDAWRMHTLDTPRHRFAARHRRTLFAAIALVFPLTAWLAGNLLDTACLRAGLALVPPMLAYLALAHFFPRLRLPKEWLIALLFAAGVAAFPLATAPAGELVRFAATLVAVAGFAGLAGLNCLAIERWESTPSPSTPALLRAVLHLARAAAVALVLIALTGTEYPVAIPYIGLLAGAAGLAWLIAMPTLPLNARRALADAVLLGPLIALTLL